MIGVSKKKKQKKKKASIYISYSIKGQLNNGIRAKMGKCPFGAKIAALYPLSQTN